MLYITYEAVRPGVPRTEVCVAKVWHKLDGSHDVMSNTCKFTVESVAGAGAGAGKAGGEGPEPVRLMGGFHTLDHNSEARP